ncbi:helix-turn-helix domain-containing protein [Planobispora takensis]|uniref:HTH cro/C1-type domain-containing protein n=1 Tax=Planobispora takensis TaxID=1367882 RepID=A0A8J3SSW0_9ACTN|nr:helix-turn-helix transcriptional regulator [Planobispora takensis]GIH98110.1 hypothetical protein Pta02_01190 [Planobispora takensis]
MTHSSLAHNGETIRALRKLHHRTVTDLAGAVGITPQSMSNIELEHKTASATTLNKIAGELGVGLGAICRTRIATEPSPAMADA